MLIRGVLGPLLAGVTYRRAVHLLLGAVLLLPYLALGWLFTVGTRSGAMDGLALALLLVVAVVVGVGVAFVPGVRSLEVTAARALLDVGLPDPTPGPDSWAARRNAAAWLLLNLVAGGAAALLVLIVLPNAAGLLVAPWRAQAGMPVGLAAAWAPPLGLLLLVLVPYVLAAGGAGLARLAPALLGPTPTERMAAELERAHRTERALAERNRLARELHDSVGHALTVTTLQAGAAARVLDSDPAFVARALDAIAEAGRTALAELDHVLGLLRDGAADGDGRGAGTGAPQPDLGDLDALLEGTRSAGVPVRAELVGETAAVPSAVSREAYRIVQEGLTNALRHAGPVAVTVRVAVDADAVEMELTNPLGNGTAAAAPPRPGGGRGLAGMQERVGVLRGEFAAGPRSGVWRVHARLPLAP